MRLTLLETGGTINGILSPEDSAAPPSDVQRWLQARQERLGLQLSSRTLCMRDSRAIGPADREQLRAAIEVCEDDAILIPHGTYTLNDTAVFLMQALTARARAKSIVLVGSLRPLREPHSDGRAALRMALDALREGRAGVNMTVGEGIWAAGTVEKDPKTGRFRAAQNPSARST